MHRSLTLMPLLLGALGLTLLGQEGCQGADEDGDGWTTAQDDCNDLDPAVFPGALEVCDGVDNDCDGHQDEVPECYAGPAPLVTTTAGMIEGVAADDDTFAFLGVRFAAPPVGARRWQPPVDPEPWTGVLEANAFGPACPQASSQDEDGDGVNDMAGSEDCLFLNVWRPRAESASPRPIMLWIHGGGNTTGSEDAALYNMAKLAAEVDAVVVTIQYRLSFLGWLTHPVLDRGQPLPDSGNLAMMDMMKALQWTRDNAAAFGGDTSRVTVFGESAGGFNTWSLLLAPAANGLFSRAIVESGCPLWATWETARAQSQQLFEWLVVADGLATAETAGAFLESQGEAWVREYVYGKSAADILKVASVNNGMAMATWGPIQDGQALPLDAMVAISQGKVNRVPLLIGSNRDEMKLFMAGYSNITDEEYDAVMQSYYGDRVPEIEALYPREAYTPATPYNQLADIMDSYLEVMCGEYAAWLASPHLETWLYNFQYDNLTPPMDYIFGATHAMEMPFVFNNFGIDIYAEGSDQERHALTQTMQGYWGCFAQTGNPSACGNGPSWPRLQPNGSSPYQRMILDTNTRVETLPTLNLQRWNLWVDVMGLNSPTVTIP